MNTLIYYSFNLAILAVVLLIVGLIKPKWLFFWMDDPGRFPPVFLASALLMAALTMFGEGNKQFQAEKQQAAKTGQPAAEVPVPVPTTTTPVPAPQP
jgi:hypothetical protein